ncbi:hypothetical protein OBBRIDRAFT_813825 [Obba rivulosa]|uniref:CCHC-type domain-containing protein n=1 Tax=Obba rivulosa TaxID=1052685 RepID=A0A8E2AZ37_9APHY|nr:hypothetical protein OBBRIDRAFT_813825 [Obba rivulosa]
MTRYTNFARKRTHVEAGFDTPALERESESLDGLDNFRLQNDGELGGAASSDPPGKRQRNNARILKHEGDNVPDSVDGPPRDSENTAPGSEARSAGKRENKMQKRRIKGADARKQASEQRRLKRKDERYANTICFACREYGHAAKDCTNAIATGENGAEDGQAGVARPKAGRSAVGICYRCGSRKHNLSKCREPVDSENPLPYASCFVCSGKGHLASSCPKNQSKGIYPNGGSCKLCGETTHLAKDCPLRKKAITTSTAFLGTGREAGADEDDFHTFKRKNAEIDKAEKFSERAKRQANVKVGAFTGVVKAFGKSPAPATKKKVVSF